MLNHTTLPGRDTTPNSSEPHTVSLFYLVMLICHEAPGLTPFVTAPVSHSTSVRLVLRHRSDPYPPNENPLVISFSLCLCTPSIAPSANPATPTERIAAYKQLIAKLPLANQYLLLYVLDLLKVFAKHEQVNKMGATSMSSCVRSSQERRLTSFAVATFFSRSRRHISPCRTQPPCA